MARKRIIINTNGNIKKDDSILNKILVDSLNKKLLKKVENNLWNVTNWNNKNSTVSEIERLDPEIIFIDKSNMDEFNILRQNIHSMEYVQNPGRVLKSIVIDKPTGMYLGVLTIASDFTSLENRDKHIGWSDTDKYKDKKLNNTAVMSSCVSVQPLGFNCLGGKLMSMVATTSPVRDIWKKK